MPPISNRRRLLARCFGVLAVALVVAGCASAAKPAVTTPATSSAAPTNSAPSTTAPSTTAAAVPTSPVHMSTLEADGATYGVGMPIVVFFNQAITDASLFDRTATVRVNSQPANGAWWWMKSSRDGYVYEAHYRLQTYWPAHSHIDVNLPMQGLSAGPGLAFDDSLTLSYDIGAKHYSLVDGTNEQMVVQSDDVTVRTMPVSLGKARTPTYDGTKVVMELDRVQHMVGSGGEHYSVNVPWSVRITMQGEFIHAASWNGGNIGQRSTSSGCTNLNTADAEWFFGFSQVGDLVTYSNTGGDRMPTWDGFGDWNVPWASWQQGNLLSPTN